MELAAGAAQMPAKSYLYFPRYGGDLRIMPGYMEKSGIAGAKIVNVHPKNRGLPTVMALIVLNDPKTGLPLAVMDGTYITRMRTAAAAAIATKYLSRPDSHSLGVVGAGGQAKYQIAGVAAVRDLKEILVSDVNEKAVDRLRGEMKRAGIVIRKAGMRQACSRDILTTITPVRKPIVKYEWIREGMHINAIGADAKGKEELEPAILKRAKIFIDDWEQASHSGEINVPLSKGLIAKGDIHATLGEVVSGKRAGREKGMRGGKGITVFDSTGLSIQDISIAGLVLKQAKKNGMGRRLEF